MSFLVYYKHLFIFNYLDKFYVLSLIWVKKNLPFFSLKWYDAIFNNIAKDEVIQNELSNVTETIILVKYQYEGRKVFINDIVRKMHIAKEN